MPGFIIRNMVLWAGLLSFILLLASRLSGAARESGVASVFGIGPVADAMVLMLTLPDVVVGVGLSGAMSYVLIPYWTKLPADELALHQRKILCVAVLAGLVLALALLGGAGVWGAALSPSLWQNERELVVRALQGAALAVPCAFAASVLGAQLQLKSDMVGLYASNLAVNGALIGMLCWLAWLDNSRLGATAALNWMALGLLIGMLARLGWQAHRLGWPQSGVKLAGQHTCRDFCGGVIRGWWQPLSHPRPRLNDWGAAMVVSGAPLLLYLVARSLASREGAGSLAAFNYAWKLVELPQLLVVQVVATLALPALSRAVVQGNLAWVKVFRRAFALAWVLACAAVVALVWGSAALAQLLFGWGQMNDAAVEQVAAWGATGAASLLPCAAVYMWLVLLASWGRLREVAWNWLVIGVMASLLGVAWVQTGHAAMVWLNAVWLTLAVGMCFRNWALIALGVPWRELALPTSVALASIGLVTVLGPLAAWASVLTGAVSVACLLLATWWASPSFRQSIQPNRPDAL